MGSWRSRLLASITSVKLPKNFEYNDDVAIDNLHRCLEELKKNKLDFAGAPPPNELPKEPFGLFKPDVVLEHKAVVRRREVPSIDDCCEGDSLKRQESLVISTNERESNRHSDLSGAEASFDEGSSLLGEGSHKSLAGTSITSTADLSIFSATTISQIHDFPSINTGEGDSDDGQSSSGLATPLVVSKFSPSPDVVRIFVPYINMSQTSHHSLSQNGSIRIQEEKNKITIKIEEQFSVEENQTPLVEQHSIFMTESSSVDLK